MYIYMYLKVYVYGWNQEEIEKAKYKIQYHEIRLMRFTLLLCIYVRYVRNKYRVRHFKLYAAEYLELI